MEKGEKEVASLPLPVRRAQAAQMYADGMFLREVAEAVGVSWDTIRHWHTADGYSELRKKRRAEAMELAARQHDAAMAKAMRQFGSTQAEIVQKAQTIVLKQLTDNEDSPTKVEVAMRSAKHAQSIADSLTGGGKGKGKGGGGVRVNILTQAAHVQSVTEE